MTMQLDRDEIDEAIAEWVAKRHPTLVVDVFTTSYTDDAGATVEVGRVSFNVGDATPAE